MGMKNIAKFVSLILSTFFIVFMLLSTVRLWGEGQRYFPYDSEYFKAENVRANEELILPWEQSFFLEQDKHIILWIETYIGSEVDAAGKEQPVMLAMPWMDRDKPRKSLEKKSSPTRPLLRQLLAEILEKYPQARFIISCDDNREQVHQYLSTAIEQAHAETHVIIQSKYDTILISLKEQRPTWLFGSTPSDLARVKTMDGMWLLAAAPFKGDVMIVPLKHRGRDSLNHNIVQELKKRFKKIIIGPLNSAEEARAARQLQADGLFYSDPTVILQ